MSIEFKSFRYRSTGTKFHESTKAVLVDDCGHKKLAVLMMDGHLIVVKVPKEEGRFMSDPVGKEKAMTTRIKQFRAYGRRNGMSKAAKAFLTKATKAAKAA